MNIAQIKYVLEIYKTKSISKAAENLYMGQPNLSRAIKELEDDLNIKIFNRTKKGIEVTADGEEFVQQASKILLDIVALEKQMQSKKMKKSEFSFVCPRATYIEQAYIKFLQLADLSNPFEFVYKETNSLKAINKVLQGEYNLGIIRYRSSFDHYFQKLFEEKGLEHLKINEFIYNIILNKNNKLTEKECVTQSDLNDMIEVCHPDPYVPSIPFNDVKKMEFSSEINKRIYIHERGSQFDILEQIDNTFMWVSPVSKNVLDKYNLVQIPTSDEHNTFSDILIYRKGYKFTLLDRLFLEILEENK